MNADVDKIVADAIIAYRNTNDLQFLAGVSDQIASLVAPDYGPEVGWRLAEAYHLARGLGHAAGRSIQGTLRTFRSVSPA